MKERKTMRAAAALFLALAAVSVSLAVQPSGASYASSSVNPGSLFSTGSLTLTDSHAGSAVVSAGGLVPGDSVQGTLVISLAGDYSADVMLSTSGATDQPSSPALSEALDLTIEDVTSGTQILYDGTLAGFSSLSLAQFAPGASKTYRFTVTFPAANDDAGLQNASTSMSLTFTGVAI